MEGSDERAMNSKRAIEDRALGRGAGYTVPSGMAGAAAQVGPAYYGAENQKLESLERRHDL